jgi:hypothetical protein
MSATDLMIDIENSESAANVCELDNTRPSRSIKISTGITATVRADISKEEFFSKWSYVRGFDADLVNGQFA